MPYQYPFIHPGRLEEMIVNKPEDVSPDSLWHLAIENYYTKIVNVVYYLSRDPVLAEDMAQEAFAIALEKFHQKNCFSALAPSCHANTKPGSRRMVSILELR